MSTARFRKQGGYKQARNIGTSVFNADGGISTRKLQVVGGDALIHGITVGRGGNGVLQYNTVLGYYALKNNTTGVQNVAVGWQTLLKNTNGNNNIALGTNTLSDNTSGGDNVAVGTNALKFNTIGTENVAIGIQALQHNTTGKDNVAIGEYALFSSETSDSNTAVGHSALSKYTCGSSNTAIGYKALYTNTGDSNTAVGFQAGVGPLSQNTTGVNNTFIGYNSVGASDTASNEIILGNSSITTLRCATQTIDALSDERDKKDIIDIPYGLDLINNLQPRQFTWAMRGEPDSNPNQGTTRIGFIAQEVQTVLGEDNNVLNMVKNTNPERLEMSYGQLVPVLTKAVQELYQELTAEKAKTGALETKVADLETRLASLEAK